MRERQRDKERREREQVRRRGREIERERERETKGEKGSFPPAATSALSRCRAEAAFAFETGDRSGAEVWGPGVAVCLCIDYRPRFWTECDAISAFHFEILRLGWGPGLRGSTTATTTVTATAAYCYCYCYRRCHAATATTAATRTLRLPLPGSYLLTAYCQLTTIRSQRKLSGGISLSHWRN